MNSVAEPTGVQVLDRSVWIVDAVADAVSASLGELTTATGIPRPTVHRLAVALERQRILRRDGDGRFRLGGRLVGWGGAAARAWPIVELAQPVLETLSAKSGESAQLYVREGDRRVCVARAERASGLRDTVPLGAALPLDKGSGGTVLLAFTGARGRRHAAARAAGWAESVGEREPGVASVSAPVFGPASNGPAGLAGAISVSGPVDRLGRSPGKRLAPVVTAAARALTRQLELGRVTH
jgi:DNA-binding IclR family transcriptional regulator